MHTYTFHRYKLQNLISHHADPFFGDAYYETPSKLKFKFCNYLTHGVGFGPVFLGPMRGVQSLEDS